MLSIFLILVLLYSFYTGWRRGLIMQAIQLVGYVITFLLATRYYDQIAASIELLVPYPSVQQDSNLVLYNEAQSFVLDQAFYRAITFLAIWIIGWLVTKFLALFFTRVTYYPILSYANNIGGAVINVFISYCVIFALLFILSLLPIEFIQQQFVDNPLAYRIVSATPVLSQWALDAWLSVNPFS